MLDALDPRDIALLAVLASVLSAIIAAVSAYTIAKVNHAAVRRLAKETKERELRAKQLEPIGALASQRPMAWVNVLRAIAEGDSAKARALFQPLDDLPAFADSVGYMSVIWLDSLLLEDVQKFYLTNVACRELVLQCLASQRSPQECSRYVLGPHAVAAQALQGRIDSFLVDGPSSLSSLLIVRLNRRIYNRFSHRLPTAVTDAIRSLDLLPTVITEPEEAQQAALRSIDAMLGEPRPPTTTGP